MSRRRNPGLWRDAVAFWKLEQASGNRPSSISAAATLGEVGGTIGRATGKLGYGADFESGDSRYLRSLSTKLQAATFTIAGWAIMESKPAANYRWASRSNGAAKLVWRVGREFATDIAVFTLSTDGSNWGATCTTSLAAIGTATAFFWAARYNDATKKANLRINETDATQQTLGGALWTAADAAFVLGALQSGGQYFDGILDAVGFWRRVLSADELTALYKGGVGREFPD